MHDKALKYLMIFYTGVLFFALAFIAGVLGGMVTQ